MNKEIEMLARSQTSGESYGRTLEETGKLGRALIEYHKSKAEENDFMSSCAMLRIKDAIGDICVTLVIQCELLGINLDECQQVLVSRKKEFKQ